MTQQIVIEQNKGASEVLSSSDALQIENTKDS